MFSHNSHNKGNGRDSKTLITGEVSAQAPSACGRQLEAAALGAPPHGLPSRCPVLASLRKGVSRGHSGCSAFSPLSLPLHRASRFLGALNVC